MELEWRDGRVGFAGYRIAYRVAGHGPVVVLLKPPRFGGDGLRRFRVLADRYRVIGIDPLGFGGSDRPDDYPAAGLHEQVLAVLDVEAVDRFVVWGYSQGGAMAAAVAQATPRVTAMVVGGFSLVDQPTNASMTRMDRDRRVPVASRVFWRAFKDVDWLRELATLACPRLVYVGAEDRVQAVGVRRSRRALTERGVSVVEFDHLDHRSCDGEPAVSTRVVPAVVDWLESRTGGGW